VNVMCDRLYPHVGHVPPEPEPVPHTMRLSFHSFAQHSWQIMIVPRSLWWADSRTKSSPFLPQSLHLLTLYTNKVCGNTPYLYFMQMHINIDMNYTTPFVGGVQMEADVEKRRKQRRGKIKITILYDNKVLSEGLRSSWGFSCLIKADGENIMFDTGSESSLLLFNMKKLGIDPQSIDKLVLSHPHIDHTRGLPAILEVNRRFILCLPKSFPSIFKAKVANSITLVEVDEPFKISNDLYTLGELG
jgi:hypothetical protein